MTDRERFGLRGAVQALDVHVAELDPSTSDWAPPRHAYTMTFDREGRQEGRPHPADTDTVSTCDERGRRTTIGSRPPEIHRGHGMQYGLMMDPAVKYDVLTRYDAHDRAVDISYRAADTGQVLDRVLLTYDDRGRIVREQILIGERFSRPERVAGPAASESLEPPPSGTDIAAALRLFMPDGVLTTIEYDYDDRSQVARRRQRMGPLAEEDVSYAYDDFGSVVEEHRKQRTREGDVDEHGRLITANESSDESWTRFEYRYDERGNWTERVVLTRQAPDRHFHRSNIQRRTITYF